MNKDSGKGGSTPETAVRSGAARVLVMAAVEAEREALLRGLGAAGGFDAALAGVGPASAAAATARLLAEAQARGTGYALVISAGIAGGFAERAPVGSLVVADEIVAADLGAETPEGFASVDELGFGSTRIAADGPLAARAAEALAAAGLAVCTGPVVTVSTVTGTAAAAAELARRVPGAAAEAMEGFGVATAASLFGIPVLEIRAISNAVGPRDRSAWRIKDALDALAAAGAILAEVLE